MSTSQKILQLTQTTSFKGVSIRRLPLKVYFKVIELWRNIRIIDQRLLTLVEYYDKGKIDKFQFIKIFKNISKFTIELNGEFLTHTLNCNHHFIDNILKTLKINRDKIVAAYVKGRPILKRSNYKTVKLSFWKRLKMRRKVTIIDDTYDGLTLEIMQFNFPELFEKHEIMEAGDEIEQEPDDRDPYLEIVSLLSVRFSRQEIDDMMIGEAKYFIQSIHLETVREYFLTHFQGIRYFVLSQSSYENDPKGKKRNADMQEIVATFRKTINREPQKFKKSAFITDMEREALEVMKTRKRSKNE